MSSAWLRPEKSPVETGQGRQVARVCMVRRPREGFFQVKKTSSKAGMWVCKDHSGFSVAHRLKDWGGGIRDGKGVRTDGLAGPLPLDGSAHVLKSQFAAFSPSSAPP